VKSNRHTISEKNFVENPSMSALSVESASHAYSALSNARTAVPTLATSVSISHTPKSEIAFIFLEFIFVKKIITERNIAVQVVWIRARK
jgi:hypothetical protein